MSRRGGTHATNAVASFSLLKRERIKKRSTERGRSRSDILITSMFCNSSVGMVRAIRCHRQNMKTDITDDSKVSGYPVASKLGYLIEVLKSIPYTI